MDQCGGDPTPWLSLLRLRKTMISSSPGKLQLPLCFGPDSMPRALLPGQLLHNAVSGLNPLLN